ncbi:ubiquinone anaerobic biosynthesis protein UbiU [Cohaesibacter celericrescens]|uniref:Ubiquinone biosynthesis protein UbiU n=1 Tax=Cohaesibacter celericrescens TaxID=2067669 RepID=A0A2N5XTA3_9HYPH|nr:peptidase U32 family protein [Cohaesibacter celericrescens]PLW77700.1 protease [Cohaesibacter celericrescens]
MELVCPAGTPAALRTAVDAGADTVYCGFRNETNARNFPGLNFSLKELHQGIEYAAERGAKVLVAVNTFAQAGNTDLWRKAVDDVANSNAHAIILADLGMLDYAAQAQPDLRVHLSVQAAAANADMINYYATEFGVKRVVLPRVLTVQEIEKINAEITCETEVFIFGGLCVMAEGRCALSSYCTGKSPNINGVCSPPGSVKYEDQGDYLESTLEGITINQYPKGEAAAYPTLCKGRFESLGETGYVFEDPVSLNAAHLLPQLQKAGVTALKIEGRQRGKAYMAKVVKSFRQAVDAVASGTSVDLDAILAPLTEGQKSTKGSYQKTWR